MIVADEKIRQLRSEKDELKRRQAEEKIREEQMAPNEVQKRRK